MRCLSWASGMLTLRGNRRRVKSISVRRSRSICPEARNRSKPARCWCCCIIAAMLFSRFGVALVSVATSPCSRGSAPSRLPQRKARVHRVHHAALAFDDSGGRGSIPLRLQLLWEDARSHRPEWWRGLAVPVPSQCPGGVSQCGRGGGGIACNMLNPSPSLLSPPI